MPRSLHEQAVKDPPNPEDSEFSRSLSQNLPLNLQPSDVSIE